MQTFFTAFPPCRFEIFRHAANGITFVSFRMSPMNKIPFFMGASRVILSSWSCAKPVLPKNMHLP
jgi:hypothetical protein